MISIRSILGISIALLLLSGCGFTATGDWVRDTIKVKGAQAYDEGLANAEWELCEMSSIGSIKRRYGTSLDRSFAYNEFCDQSGIIDILQPEEDTP